MSVTDTEYICGTEVGFVSGISCAYVLLLVSWGVIELIVVNLTPAVQISKGKKKRKKKKKKAVTDEL